jgi:hypothetical protein
MITILSTFVPAPCFGLRSRACLELELIALRHQVSLLRRQHKGHDEDIEQIEANGRNNEQAHGGDVRRVVAQQCVPSQRRRSSVACLAASGYCATRGPAAVAVGRVMASAIALPSALARQA